jgi:flavin reductase (DIM6/NTAB) family NADH-FMN oxidoreductase RutF
MVFYTPENRDRELLPHDPFKAFVAPRPIGWISTVGPGGEVNLAPYSYFNAVSDHPPVVMFSSAGPKDSVTFAHATEEFVWNMATWELREAMNLTSATLPRGESEFAHAGLAAAPSRLVAPPRVADTPVAFECRVIQRVEIGSHLVTFGEVVGVHVDERYIVDGRFDTAGARPIARCGYRGDYAVVTELFELLRPR